LSNGLRVRFTTTQRVHSSLDGCLAEANQPHRGLIWAVDVLHVSTLFQNVKWIYNIEEKYGGHQKQFAKYITAVKTGCVPDDPPPWPVVARCAERADADAMLQFVESDPGQFAVFTANWLGKDPTRKAQAKNEERVAVLEEYKLVALGKDKDAGDTRTASAIRAEERKRTPT